MADEVTMRILGCTALAWLLLGCGAGKVETAHDAAAADAPVGDTGHAGDGGQAADTGPTDGPPAATDGGGDGAAGQFGTGGTVSPEYVTEITGGGAKPSAADGLAASCPGDCTTDATDCLQAAADAARDAGKPLVIPAPTGACYRITHWVQVYGSVVGVDYPLIKVDGATGDSDQSALRVHGYAGAGMWITGLRIDGGWDPTGATDPGGGEWSSGIDLADSANVTIRDNQIQNTAGDSIYLGSNGTGESNIIIDGNDLVNAYRCSIAFIHATGVVVTNNTITKLGEYVIALDFEPNDPPNEQVLDVEIAANATSVPDGDTGCSMCTDFVVGASCSPNQGSAHGGSLFVHHNTVAAYMAANVTEGDGPGFGENNSSTWSGPCASQWQQGANVHGGGFYVWENPPGSGTTNGNAPP
jgi:parallel beta-helix repeat protein